MLSSSGNFYTVHAAIDDLLIPASKYKLTGPVATILIM